MIEQRLIFLVGAFPPPVHGMALVNQSILNKLMIMGISPLLFNLSPRSLNRGLKYWIVRVWVFMRAYYGLWSSFRNLNGVRPVLYLSLSAGLGAWLDLALLNLATAFRVPAILHHHSFAYLYQPHAAIRKILRLQAPLTHVVLCPAMESGLKSTYLVNYTQSFITVGNSWLVEDTLNPERIAQSSMNTSFVIGHLANLGSEKGLYTVIEVFKVLSARGIPVKLSLAGPANGSDAQVIEALKVEFPGQVEWSGPVYEAEKGTWYETIDVFLFPSTYPNEAYPLVLVEALSRSIPVFATCRGCMEGILAPNGWAFQDSEFVAKVSGLITIMVNMPDNLLDYRNKARILFNKLHDEDKVNYDELIKLLCVEI